MNDSIDLALANIQNQAKTPLIYGAKERNEHFVCSTSAAHQIRKKYMADAVTWAFGFFSVIVMYALVFVPIFLGVVYFQFYLLFLTVRFFVFSRTSFSC